MLLRVNFLGAIIALLGIGMFALPTGILASGFAEGLQRRRGERRICPHCGMDSDKTPETSVNSK
jgi:voltage-gated potassium channel